MAIYDDIKELVENTPYVGYFSMWCPFDEHKSMALFVYEDEDKPEDKRWFRCVSCGKVGNHQYLWKVLTGKSTAMIPGTRKVDKFLPNWKKWNEKYGSIEALVQKAHDNVAIFPTTHAWYINKRRLMPVYELCKLGYIEEWATFPILDPQGRVIDVIVRDTKGRSKYIIHANDEDTPLLYVPSWRRVMESKTVYIVYGIVDALALEMCGLACITGSTGKSLSEKRLIQLNKKWVIVPDKNEDDAARKLAKSLGNFTKIIRLPWSKLEECSDPDSVRMKFGLDYLNNLLTNL